MSILRKISGVLTDRIEQAGVLVAAATLGVMLVAVSALDAAAPDATGASVRGSRSTGDAPATSEAAVAGKARPSAVPEAPAPRTGLYAFYVNFDEEGLKTLEREAEHIDVLMPMWFQVDGAGRLQFDARHAERVAQLVRAKHPDMKIMPLVNGTASIGAQLADPAQRASIAQQIVTAMSQGGYAGVNIDFEGFTVKDRDNVVAFMATLYPLAKQAGLEVSMDVYADSKSYDYPGLARNADYLIPMMYDQHWKTSPPGPVSSIPWFERTLARFLAQVPAEKVVPALGLYSYDWRAGGGRAKGLTFQQASAIASQSGVTPGFNMDQMNWTFGYQGADGPHAVWMLDSTSVFNQVSIASRYPLRGYVVWRLGGEDPAVWNVLPNRDRLDARVAKSLADPGETILYDDARKLITFCGPTPERPAKNVSPPPPGNRL